MLLSGIVYQQVETAEMPGRGVHDFAAERLPADISAQQQAAPGLLLHQPLGLLRIGMLLEIGDRHIRALAGEMHRHRAPDAAVAAGDEGHSAVQLGPLAVAAAGDIVIEKRIEERRKAMPELLYRCPVTGEEISLGISVDADVFEKTEFDYRTVECSRCGQRHEWTKEDVYLQVPPVVDRRTRERKQGQDERFPGPS